MKASHRHGFALLFLLLAACTSPPVASPPDVELREILSVGEPPIDTLLPADDVEASEPVTREDPPAARPVLPAARLRSDALPETSGLAVSTRDGEVLWAINDGGNRAALHALTRDGTALGVWPVAARNRDWEDLAAFRSGGIARLLIADTGDNRRRRDEYALHLIDEPPARGPGAAAGTTLEPSRTIRFRYEDGSHDVEAVGVDDAGTAWLLVKEPLDDGRPRAAGVYTLSLDATAGEDRVRIARRVATLTTPARGFVSRLGAVIAGIDLDQPTAFAFAPGGRDACLLSYRQVRCFERAEDESWREALTRRGRVLVVHGLNQAEALAISADGYVWFTSEGRGAPLRALPLVPRGS